MEIVKFLENLGAAASLTLIKGKADQEEVCRIGKL